MHAGKELLLHWTTWLFKGSLCIECEGCGFSVLRDLRVTIASALDLILHETCTVARSNAPAIPEGICGSFSREFHSQSEFEPPITCCCVSTIPSWGKWLRTSRGMFPNYFGMIQMGPPSSAKLLLGGATCIFSKAYEVINNDDWYVRLLTSTIRN